MFRNKKIVVIGGGTGTYSVLSGLKKLSDNITAVVTMADSGGSAKKERDQWGLLPSSDIRKSLLALADVSQEDSLLLRRLFEYRFREGRGLKGMTFGNLYLVTLAKLLGSQKEAIKKAGNLLKIKGKVLPVTLEKIDLVAYYQDGSRVVGEHFIDQPKHNGKLKIIKLTTNPTAGTTKEVLRSLKESEVIIIGPGGFYTTIIANLIIKGVSKAIVQSKAKVIFIMNLMTEFGQTYGFSAKKYLEVLNNYIPRKKINYVFINNSPLPKIILDLYKKANTFPIKNDLPINSSYEVISQDFVSEKIYIKDEADPLKRSLLRHDPDKIANWCMKVIK